QIQNSRFLERYSLRSVSERWHCMVHSLCLATCLLIWMIIPTRVLAADELLQVHEDFSKDPGWEFANNRVRASDPPTVKQDFGWSPTNKTGGSNGEIGGTIWQSRTP